MSYGAMTDAEREFEAELDGSPEALRAIEEVKMSRAVDIRSAALGGDLIGEFRQSQDDRLLTEQRWLDDLRQFKGVYTAEQLDAMDGSKYYSRKTRAKVTAVTAKQVDMLFPSSGLRNFSIEATPEPTIREEERKMLVAELWQMAGRQPTHEEITKAVKRYADETATRMESHIADQLIECGYSKVARSVMLSGNLYGTGVLKGPLVQRKSRITYKPGPRGWQSAEKQYVIPFVEATSLWNFYPDMSATDISACRYVWERRVMTQAAILDLAKRKSFRGELLRRYVLDNPSGKVSEDQHFEVELRDMGNRQIVEQGRGKYELLERWGWLTANQLEAAGINCGCREIWFANVWVTLDGDVVKAVMAPVEVCQYPYHLYYFDKDETSIFGEGLASLMREDQDKINSAERALLDNASITTGAMYEVFAKHLDPSDDPTDLYPRKVFIRNSGDPQYPVVRPIVTPSHTNELSAIAQMFDDQADQNSGIPKFSYGQEPPRDGALGTASGFSMAMGQANVAMKSFIANFDDVTHSFITSLYHWNMKYNKDNSIKGDFEANAVGASSLVAKEIRAGMIAQLTSTIQPEERPFYKWQKIAEARGEALELSDVVMTEQEAAEANNNPQAQQAQQMMQMQQQLSLAQLEAQVAKLQAEVAKTQADSQKALAEAARIAGLSIKDRTEAAFSALQAGGVAATSQASAIAGDEILRSAGWVDATPQTGVSDIPVPEQLPPAEAEAINDLGATPGVGEQAGIETPQIEGIQQ